MDLLLHNTNYRVGGISWNNLGVVEHVELFSGVATGVEHDSLFTSRVVWQERSYVEDLSVDDDPDIIFLRVLSNLFEGKDLSAGLRWLGLRLRLWLDLWLKARSANL